MSTRKILALGMPCIVCIAISACVPNMKADMSGYSLVTSNSADPISNAIVVDATNSRFTHRKTGNRAVAPILGHNMGSLDSDYAKGVDEALFRPGRDSSEDRKKAVLALESVDVLQIVGEGFASFEITEQVIATWTLYNADRSESYFDLKVSGGAASKNGWGKTIALNAKDRLGRAYQDLLENTLRDFSDSQKLRRFGLIADLYLYPDRELGIAEEILATNPASKYPELLDAMRAFSVMQDWPELYKYSSEQILGLDLKSVKDESSILHAAIATPQFDDSMVISIIANSEDLETLSDEDMTPLEASLAFGRDSVAVELVSAGARPLIRYSGNSYVSAEISYRLVHLMIDASAPYEEVAVEAAKQYEHAIEEANFAIGTNDVSIFVGRIMKVIGPVVQYSVAAAEANYEARQSAKASPVGLGFGYAEFNLQEYDTKSPAAAITDLRALVSHCEARVAELNSL